MGRISKEEEKIKCLICNGENIEVTELKEELKMENNIIYIPIEIPVCRHCGERYYDRKPIRYLETVEQKLKFGKETLQEIGKVLIL